MSENHSPNQQHKYQQRKKTETEITALPVSLIHFLRHRKQKRAPPLYKHLADGFFSSSETKEYPEEFRI